MRRNLPLLVVLGAGLLLRLVLAFVVFPGQGFASDLRLFASWADAPAAGGPGTFYGGSPSANYPPGYLYVLWALGALSHPVTAGLLKLPAILADVGVALLVNRMAARWRGPRAGVVAAALYLFIPVTWYDSALWGQVDAVAALAMMAALVLLVEGRSEPAAAAAAIAVCVKPQALVCLVVVAPVLLRRHLLVSRTPVRLATSATAAVATAAIVLAPFDIARFAPAGLAGVPVIGELAGLVGLVRSTGDQYSVLTANAYNLWALIGPHPLVDAVGTWTSDAVPVAWGTPAVDVGAALLGTVCLLVFAGLLRRDGAMPVLLGFTLVAFAFYALPTRVHERYLFPVFASGAVLASGVVIRAAGYLAAGILNTVNLHAVLAAPVGFGQRGFGGGPGFGGRGPGPGFGPGPDPGLDVTSLQLPLADLARSPLVASAVAVGQTAALAGLVALWLLLVVGAGEPPSSPARSRRVPEDQGSNRSRAAPPN